MEMRWGMVWGVAITLMSGVITLAYVSRITERSLEGLIFFPITGALAVVAGAFGGWRGRTGTWAVGLSLGSGATLFIAAAIRFGNESGNETLFLVLALLPAVGTHIGTVLAFSITGWLPAHWMRGRMLR